MPAPGFCRYGRSRASPVILKALCQATDAGSDGHFFTSIGLPLSSLQRLPPLREAGLLLGYVLLYVFLDWFSYTHPVAPFAITPWNPPPGLSLVLLLRFRLGYWPVLFVAAWLSEWLVRGLAAPLPLLALSCAIMTAGYSGAAAFLRRTVRIDSDLTRLRDLSCFVAVVIVVTLPIAASYVAVFLFAGLIPQDEFIKDVLLFWGGDVIGIVVTTPVFLTHWPSRSRDRALRWGVVEYLQFLTLLAALWLVFGWEVTDEFRYFYILFLPLVWIAMRHGIGGATLAIIAIQLGLIGFVQTSDHEQATVLELQMLMFTLTLTGLFLGMTVTERRRVESSLSQRENALNHALRLAAVSEMASALAHELNQPLSAIGSYVRACQLLALRPEDASRLTSTLDKVAGEVARAGQVVHRLRDFFRGGVMRLEPASLSQLVDGALATLAKRAERARVQIRTTLPGNLPPVLVDPVQMETVLHNLLANAIDALQNQRDETRTIEITAQAARGELLVSIRDNGPGIATEIGEHLFENFTTTKPDGLGLGLSMSRSIVEAHGGRLWLVPSSDGACFTFALPIAQPASISHDPY